MKPKHNPKSTIRNPQFSIGVIGCGNMGSALIGGMLGRRFIAPGRLTAWDPDAGRLRRVRRTFHIDSARSNREVARANLILLAVKPQQMEEVLRQIAPHLSHRPLLVSIAAGVSSRFIERCAGASVRVVRVMPNTPALVGAGVSALAKGRFARSADMLLTRRVFSCVGEVVEVPERWMDAVTAVSGSGPAYFFYLMEELIRAAVGLGLPPKAAAALVLETAVGTAKLAVSSGESPALLRARVTSKGGTTEAAFRVFAQGKLGKVLRAGVRAACARSRELGR